MGEADITRKTRMKAIANFLQKVLRELASSPRTETDAKKKKKKKKKKQPTRRPSRYFEVGTQTEPVAIPSTSVVYETPKPRFTIGEISDDNDDDDDDDFSRVIHVRSAGRMSAP